MVNTKILSIGMALGAVLGFWLGLGLSENLLSAWNFVLAFIFAIVGFLGVYYFYKYFY